MSANAAESPGRSEQSGGTNLLSALGVGAGLAAYAYGAGGVFEYLRFLHAKLPVIQALALVSSRELIVTGVIVGLFAIPLWVLTNLCAKLWDKHVQKGWTALEAWFRKQRDKMRQMKGATQPAEESGQASLALHRGGEGAAISTLAASLFVVVDAVVGSGIGADAILAALAAAGALGGILVAIAVPFLAAVRKSGLLKLPGRWLASLFLGFALVGGASYAYFTPFYLTQAVVQLSSGGCLTGPYMSRDTGGIHLVDGKERSILTISAVDVSRVRLGNNSLVKSTPITTEPCPNAITLPPPQRVAAYPTAYAGYADSFRSGTHNPTPWQGDSGVIFEGCNYFARSRCTNHAGEYDAGAIRLVNLSTRTMTMSHATVTIGPCTFDPWPRLNVRLQRGRQLVLTQTGGSPPCHTNDPGQSTFNFDTSGTSHSCTSDDGLTPVLHLMVDGVRQTYRDTDQILNTKGVDRGATVCGSHNETHRWLRMARDM
jgi:hypothetical protein